MKMIRKVLAGAAIAATLSSPAYAGYADEVAQKFGRGLCNSALGWVELGKNLYNEPTQNGPLYAPVGLLKGVAHAVGRTLTGAIDTASFLIPSQSLVQPEHVWDHINTETSYGLK